MPNTCWPPRGLAAATLLALAAAAPAAAQNYPTNPTSRYEITPLGGYQWGGSFDTDASGNIPSGTLHEEGSFSWGAILSVNTYPGTALEFFYIRQDTHVQFDPNGGDTRTVGEFANNYIQVGGRRDFSRGGRVAPFLTASLGTNILDAKDIDSNWRFSWSLGGGFRVALPSERVAIRTDVRWMVTPVPSGDYATWCNVWGCYATGGRTWLHQGHASGGLAIAF
jgi:opacity protein-like surface antigen